VPVPTEGLNKPIDERGSNCSMVNPTCVFEDKGGYTNRVIYIGLTLTLYIYNHTPSSHRGPKQAD